MSKGGSTQTVTQANPTQSAQLPYLQNTWGQAQSLYENNPLTPYSSLANTVARWGQPERTQSYQDLYNTAQQAQGLNAPTTNAYGSAVSGGYGGVNNPAWAGTQAFAQGTAEPQQNFQNLQDLALRGGQLFQSGVSQYANPMAGLGWQGAQNNNLGLSQLGNTASGSYLNANPYINAAIQAAQRPVTENYQTSIAPTMDAALASSGRYGSGAQQALYGQSQDRLAQGLGDISTKMIESNYRAERAAQDQAANQYGTLYNAGLGLGMQGLGNAASITNQAGNQYFQGLGSAQNAAQQQMAGQQSGLSGLAGMWNQGNDASLRALNMYPQLAQGLGTGARMGAEAGTGLAAIQQSLINEEMQKWQEAVEQPYKQLDRFSGYIGNPQSGSMSTPYHTNQFADALSGITGVAGLGKTLGLFGGSSGGGQNYSGGGGIGGPQGDFGYADRNVYTPSWSGMSGGGGGTTTSSGGGGSVLGGLSSLGGIASGIGSLFSWI